jgi:hypothetical protein
VDKALLPNTAAKGRLRRMRDAIQHADERVLEDPGEGWLLLQDDRFDLLGAVITHTELAGFHALQPN